jgi:hypothetical protein
MTDNDRKNRLLGATLAAWKYGMVIRNMWIPLHFGQTNHSRFAKTAPQPPCHLLMLFCRNQF